MAPPLVEPGEAAAKVLEIGLPALRLLRTELRRLQYPKDHDQDETPRRLPAVPMPRDWARNFADVAGTVIAAEKAKLAALRVQRNEFANLSEAELEKQVEQVMAQHMESMPLRTLEKLVARRQQEERGTLQ